ncbi:Membrane transport protein [Novipirellula aureliae]|uniref:Membrane transport protein n=1 Tax=Novipirellula aureliae TaxID=2527966 RepID=A0A5C6E323_9BACT|nr:AEC family transporter [Novipirellula aureliae]TWU43125.1 Membrane transport protein [Novipirellula aureliae]
MFSELWPIIASLLGVFLVIGIGGICRLLGWVNEEADVSLANLTAKILIPALFADRILLGGSEHSISSAWFPPLFGFGFTTLGFVLSWKLARRFGARVGLDTDSKQRTFALCAGICNYGFIPLPLATQFYPEAVVDLILHNVGVDMALWSVGIYVIGGTTSWHKAILTAPVIAVAISFLVCSFGANQWIPVSLTGALHMVSRCAVPMGLILSGAILVDYVKDCQWKGSTPVILSAIAVRQLLLPLLMLGIAIAVGLWTKQMTDDMRMVVMLEAAMPAAVFPIVLVRLYNRDTSTALRVVLPTSLAGILLVPIWLGVAKWCLAL